MSESNKKEMICVACPIGCQITVTLNGNEIVSVEGNACKRGESYAKTEISNPTRSLTTTVRVSGGNAPLVPVKSAQPVPKAMMKECAEALSKISVAAPVKIGDVVMKNILETGVDIIATNNCGVE